MLSRFCLNAWRAIRLTEYSAVPTDINAKIIAAIFPVLVCGVMSP